MKKNTQNMGSKKNKSYLFASQVIAVLVHKYHIGVRCPAMECGSDLKEEKARMYIAERKVRMNKKGTHPTAWLSFTPTTSLFVGCEMNVVYNRKSYPIDTSVSIMRIAENIHNLLVSLVNAK